MTTMWMNLSAGALLAVLFAGPLQAADPNPNPQVGWQRFEDPRIELAEPEIELPAGLGPLWIKALRHSESDLRRETADSIAMAAPYGLTDVEAIVDALVRVLQTPEEHPAARTAAARALVALDARRTAPLLAEHAGRGPIELSLIVEPQLALWRYEPAREMWLERLGDTSASATALRLAIECLGAVAEPRAADGLKRIVRSPTASPPTRLAAAKSLARLSDPELAGIARELFDAPAPNQLTTRLVGVHLLAGQADEEAEDVLASYAAAEETAVAAQAMQRLLEIAPERLVRRSSETLSSSDAHVRKLAVQALKTAPSEASIEALLPVLADRIPAVRQESRRVLLGMAAQDELRPAVIRGAMETLQKESWRGLEQAMLILAELGQTQSGRRMLQLLDHDQPEVYVTAAWGLKTLAVAELAPAMLESAQRLSEKISAGEATTEDSLALAHLLEALGPMGYEPADPFLRTFIPKTAPFTEGARAAAIWSLGFLAAEMPDAELVSQLEARLNDGASLPPEAPEVRAIAAISLGRMHAEEALPSLRLWSPELGVQSLLDGCCAWAVEQITGERIPPPKAVVRQLRGWFLDPLD